MFSKSRLMPTNSKASCPIKVLTGQSKIAYSLSKSGMIRLAKDLSVAQELENEDALTNGLLDCNIFMETILGSKNFGIT